MIGFFIKKAFYDGWDNLLQILLMNIIIIAIGFGGFFLASITVSILPLSFALLAVAVAVEGIVILGVSGIMARVAEYRTFSFLDLWHSATETWKHGALYGLMTGAIALVFVITVPYYLQLGNLLGFTLAVLIFWIAVIVILSLQWFLPIRSQLDKRFLKCVKKSFIIFFDNPGFSLFLFLYSAVTLIVSAFTAFLLPGISGLILAQNNALRLRLYKYDWLEKNPQIDTKAAKKMIPWHELIAEDVETLGHRTFRNFFFPWKD